MSLAARRIKADKPRPPGRKNSGFPIETEPLSPRQRDVHRLENSRRRAVLEQNKEGFRTCTGRSEPTLGEEELGKHFKRFTVRNSPSASSDQQVYDAERTNYPNKEGLVRTLVPDYFFYIQDFHHYRNDIEKLILGRPVPYLMRGKGSEKADFKTVYGESHIEQPVAGRSGYFGALPARGHKSTTERIANRTKSSGPDPSPQRASSLEEVRKIRSDKLNRTGSRLEEQKYKGSEATGVQQQQQRQQHQEQQQPHRQQRQRQQERQQQQQQQRQQQQQQRQQKQQQQQELRQQQFQQPKQEQQQQPQAQWQQQQRQKEQQLQSQQSQLSGHSTNMARASFQSIQSELLPPPGPVTTPDASRRSSVATFLTSLDERCVNAEGSALVGKNADGRPAPKLYFPAFVSRFPCMKAITDSDSRKEEAKRERRSRSPGVPAWQQYRVLCDAFRPYDAGELATRSGTSQGRPRFASSYELQYYFDVLQEANIYSLSCS